MAKKQRHAYTEEFRREAVRRSDQPGNKRKIQRAVCTSFSAEEKNQDGAGMFDKLFRSFLGIVFNVRCLVGLQGSRRDRSIGIRLVQDG